MTPLETLTQAFRKTFEDRNLSQSERKTLKDVVRSTGLDKTKRDFLNSQFYQWVEADLGKGKDKEALVWLKSANQLMADEMGAAPDAGKTFFSPGPDCLGAILHSISTARKTIDVCVFTISDDRIRNAILTRKLMGVKFRILTDNEKLLDEGSDIGTFDKEGIEVKVDRTMNHMHHKFAIFDTTSVITGSYNWTRSAEQHNHENIVLTSAPAIVKSFADTFEKLWKEMKPF